MKLKRLLSGVLAAAVALTTMAFTPFTTASAADHGDVVATYELGAENPSDVIAKLYNDGTLIISGTGAMKDYTSAQDVPWNASGNSTNITSVTVEDGITSIGDYLFQNNTDITAITIPDSVTSIGARAFRQATALKNITISEKSNLTSIRGYAFYGCTALTGDIIIPVGVTELNTGTFYGCKDTNLNVYIKGVVTSLGTQPFKNCAGKIYVYDLTTYNNISVKGYGTAELILVAEVDFSTLFQALNAAKTYESAEYTEESYKALADAVAKGNEVVANENATQDEVNAAAAAINEAITNLVEATVYTGSAGENVTWSFDKTTGVLTISGTGAWSYTHVTMGIDSYKDVITEVVVEEGVTDIADYALSSQDISAGSCFPNIEKITLASTVKTIGIGAFWQLTNLKNCDIPESVTKIGEAAFSHTAITSVNLYEGMDLGGRVFENCPSLTEVTIPKNLSYRRSTLGGMGNDYPSQLFNGCTAIEKVTIEGCGDVYQNHRTSDEPIKNGLPERLFDGCKSLQEVVIKCDDLAYVANGDSSSTATEETFETLGTNITYKVIKGSTTEKTLRDAGYITDENVVYLLDLTELNAKIAEAEAIDAENYTADSYAVLTSAIGAAKTVKANADATQVDVDSAVNALAAAIEGLEAENVDEIKASLESLAEKLEKLLTVKDESDYTAESWTALNDALKAAKDGLASEEALSYSGYKTLYDNLSGAYTGLTVASTSDSEYVGTIYGGYEVTYNHETDSYKIVVSDDVDMDSVVGTTYVKITLTPNDELKYQLSYGALNVWNFLDNLQQYKGLKASQDNVFTYNLSIPSAESAFSLTAGTGWTKETEVFYVKSVEFYNANDELLYTYSVGSVGVGDVRNLTNAIEKAQALDKSKYTEESVALLELVLEDAKATLSDKSSTKDDYRVRASELEAAVKALEEIKVELADYTAVMKAILSFPDGVNFTEESIAVFNKAVEAVVYDLDISHQAEVDAWAKAIEEAVAGLVVVPDDKGNVTGKIIVSDENAKTEMTVTAISADGKETVVKATSMGTYTLENLEAGDYTLTISGGKYAPRSYEITVKSGDNAQDVKLNPYGDINGDGDITTADVGMANSHAKGVITLTDYDFVCADVKIDGSITTADVGMINSHAKGVKALW